MKLSLARAAIVAGVVTTLAAGVGLGLAQQRGARQPVAGAEAQRAPRGYTPLQRPGGIDMRPQGLDRPTFNHNFNARQGYRIGPYHPPGSFDGARRFRYGDILAPEFFAQQYWLGDYWLFNLDEPPVGYEWVRYGADALLVDITTGEVIQTVYDAFM